MDKQVSAYIARAPKASRLKLTELRRLIMDIAPEAEERISYGMPYYDHYGRMAYFALMKGYIGLYIPSPIIADHKRELADYVTTKSAIHLPLEKKLPVALIKKLIRARIKHNKTKRKSVKKNHRA
jgi:uncharacterized protein YdhG (YjbR/CyaY superfamily)